jgi:hypothetical protein
LVVELVGIESMPLPDMENQAAARSVRDCASREAERNQRQHRRAGFDLDAFYAGMLGDDQRCLQCHP